MSSEEIELKKLKSLRKTYKCQLTKFKSYFEKESTAENIDLIQLQLRLSKIEPILEQFYDVLSKIEIFDFSVTNESDDSLEQERTDFEDNYFSIVSNVKAVLDRFRNQDDNASVLVTGLG